LKKKGQAADVASGVKYTEVLIASYVEDNTSQGKGWIFDSMFMYVLKKSCSTS